MKMKLSLQKTKQFQKKLKDLREKVKSLNESYITVGYYMDQGIHEESQLSYVDLMSIHEVGVPDKNIPARPVLELTKSGGIFSAKDRESVLKAFEGFFIKNIPLRRPLDSIGKYYEQKGKEVFGSSALVPTKDGNPPLIQTGDLSEHFSYRTSLTYKVN